MVSRYPQSYPNLENDKSPAEAELAKSFNSLAELGGARRNRTDDLFNAIEALSQLSYGPTPLICRRLGSGDRSDLNAQPKLTLYRAGAGR